MKSKQQIYNQLSSIYPFLKESDLEALWAISQHKKYSSKEIVFTAGTTMRKVAFIVSGFMRGFVIGTDGLETTVILREEGMFVGVPDGLSDNQPTKYNFDAISDCELLIFNLTDIEKLSKINDNIFDIYVGALKDSVKILANRIESMISSSAEERYKELLKKSPHLFQSIYHKHIANFLGVTPVSLSRLIRRAKSSKTQ